MMRWSALAILIIFAGALAFRLPQLDTRPLHNDEAVNAVKIAELWEQGRYRYDPDEYHGPTLHYATLPFLQLSGASGPNELPDRTLRLATVAFGAALILLLFLFAGGMSWPALVWSALFLAISPAMVFYSRYFIHEMLLLFFTALTLGAGWRYTRSRAPGWAILAGTGLGLMFATKETFVLTLAAMGIAGAGMFFLVKKSAPHVSTGVAPAETPNPYRSLSLRNAWSAIPWRDAGLALGATCVVWLLFFSSFFTNFRGLLDSVLTYFPWLKRAAGHSPHLHPWYFYLERLGWFHPVKGPVWSELLILLLAVIGTITAFRGRKSRLLQFVTLYTVALTAIYSAISYKTPWCLLSFHLGFILLAGAGAAAIAEHVRPRLARYAVVALLLAASAQLAVQAWRASYVYPADRRNPYVYAQTVPDLLNLVNRVEGIARVSPAGYETVVKVIATEDDYWPLPWHLRRFKHVGWYGALPEDPFAPIIIVSADIDARLDDKSERKWIMAGVTELRPTKFLELYVEIGLWTRFVETLPRDDDNEDGDGDEE